MRAVIWFLVVFALFNLGLLAMGIGLGYFVHWLIRDVELGTGILIGVVVSGLSIHFYSRLMMSIRPVSLAEDAEDEELLYRTITEALPVRGPRRRRKQK